jgi:protocatechuate 3,4-dioxygenase beta subunit
MRRCLVIGLGLFLGLTAAWAGDGDAAAPAPSTGSGPSTQPAGKLSASQDHIAQLIDRLGSEKYAEREAAVKELIEVGEPALAALKAAASDKTPERASRAQSTLKVIEENLIPPEEYKAKIAAYIGPTSEAERAASHKWIHQRLGATVPYLLELAPKVAGEQAVRLHLPMFDAWEEGILSDEQKTAFVSRSIRAGWRVDQSYWPGGSRIAVLEVAGLANMTPDTGYPSSKPWNFLKATWVAELDGKAVARGQTWAADATYVTLPEGLTPGKHKLKAAVELAELEGRWRFSVAADAEITVLDRGPQTAPAPAARPLAKIAGRVVDDKGKPAAKVLITAKSSAMGQNLREAFIVRTHSDEQGRFELSVPFGDIIYQVVAGLYGMYHLSKSVQIIPSNNTPVELVLDPEQNSRTIRGSVVDADGKPLGNLPVLVVGQYDQSLQTTTDPNGRFHLTTGGSLGLAVAIVGTGNLAAPLQIILDKVWDLRLEPASTLEGVVRDQDDQTPVAGATVLIRPTFANSFRMEATTGKDGRYQLGGIPAGEYTVTATAPWYFHSVGRGELPTVTLAAGENKETNIRLHHVALLRGRVVDDADKPVAGALVAAPMLAVYDYREHYGCVTTDSGGGFTIATGQVGESLPLAAFRSDRGLATIQTRLLQPGQIADGLVLRLHGTVRIKATVTDPQGKPIKDVVCSTEDNCSASGVTGPDGKFDLGRIALSTYGTVFMTFDSPRPNWGPWTRYEVTDLESAPQFYLHRQLAFKPQTAEQRDVKITLTPTPLRRISGTIFDGSDRPVAGADVHLLTGDANEGNWMRTVRPQFGSTIDISPRATVICGTRSGPDGRWTCWTVRGDGVGGKTEGRHADWTRYCIGVLAPGGKNLLIRDVVVPEASNTVELEINLEAGKSRTVTSQPATSEPNVRSTVPARPGTP